MSLCRILISHFLRFWSYRLSISFPTESVNQSLILFIYIIFISKLLELKMLNFLKSRNGLIKLLFESICHLILLLKLLLNKFLSVLGNELELYIYNAFLHLVLITFIFFNIYLETAAFKSVLINLFLLLRCFFNVWWFFLDI